MMWFAIAGVAGIELCDALGINRHNLLYQSRAMSMIVLVCGVVVAIGAAVHFSNGATASIGFKRYIQRRDHFVLWALLGITRSLFLGGVLAFFVHYALGVFANYTAAVPVATGAQVVEVWRHPRRFCGTYAELRLRNGHTVGICLSKLANASELASDSRSVVPGPVVLTGRLGPLGTVVDRIQPMHRSPTVTHGALASAFAHTPRPANYRR